MEKPFQIGALVTTLVVCAFSVPARAGIITDPSFFDVGAPLLDFDALPAGDLTDAVPGLHFSSESLGHIGFPDIIDPADIGNRFDSPMLVTEAISGGGAPVSPTYYACGIEPIGGEQPVGQFNVSDMRIDFAPPVSSFGMWFVDNDFSDVRLRAFDAAGSLLETTVIDQVVDGGATFRGLGSDLAGIAYAIIDGNPGDPNGEMLDSTFIDDLRYVPVPEPNTVLVMVALVTFGALRRRKPAIYTVAGAA